MSLMHIFCRQPFLVALFCYLCTRYEHSFFCQEMDFTRFNMRWHGILSVILIPGILQIIAGAKFVSGAKDYVG